MGKGRGGRGRAALPVGGGDADGRARRVRPPIQRHGARRGPAGRRQSVRGARPDRQPEGVDGDNAQAVPLSARRRPRAVHRHGPRRRPRREPRRSGGDAECDAAIVIRPPPRGGGPSLRRLPLRDRVGTFAWNSHRHLEVYFAAPCMGAVLHTVNIRLSADDITYIVNHAGDKILIVDASCWPTLEPIRKRLTTVEHVIVMKDTPSAQVPAGALEYEKLLADARPME